MYASDALSAASRGADHIRARRTVVSAELAELASIYERDVNVCVVEGGQGPWGSLDDVEQPVGTWRQVVHRDAAWTCGVPRLDHHLRFLIDIVCDLTGVASVGVRTRAGRTPMCPGFHVDHIPLRLVCTYYGPGTEWLDQTRGDTVVDFAQQRRCGLIRQARAGDLVLLKGEGWHDNEGGGAVHRSPSHDVERLVVSLDPLS